MKHIVHLILAVLFFSGCYSFKGISIPADVKTFYVKQVQIKATNPPPPPDSPERFMEQFRQKVRSQSSLKWAERNPDIEFDCDITSFNVTSEGAKSGNEISLNKLTISLRVEYINNKNEDDTWSKSFSYGIPFDPTLDLQEVQDDLIDDIFDQISENIFNDAFTNW